MELDHTMGGGELSRLKSQIEQFNKSLHSDRAPKQELGRDDFLKILITQLQHQDPTSPMEDKEFVAQMAQFSALEQMTNISREFQKLASLVSSGQAAQLVGRTVEVQQGDQVVEGVIEQVTTGEFPQVKLNGNYYDYEDVVRISQ